MTHRPDLNILGGSDWQTLVNLMLQYITDAVVANHLHINHSGLDIFVGRRQYIAGMEAFLAANGGGHFVPLPMWDPANPIPAEFNVVKPRDDGTPRPPMVNLNPKMQVPTESAFPAVCAYPNVDDLGNAIDRGTAVFTSRLMERWETRPSRPPPPSSGAGTPIWTTSTGTGNDASPNLQRKSSPSGYPRRTCSRIRPDAAEKTEAEAIGMIAGQSGTRLPWESK